MKKIYAGMAADLIHHGHINIIKEAKKYGKVIIGLPKLLMNSIN